MKKPNDIDLTYIIGGTSLVIGLIIGLQRWRFLADRGGKIFLSVGKLLAIFLGQSLRKQGVFSQNTESEEKTSERRHASLAV